MNRIALVFTLVLVASSLLASGCVSTRVNVPEVQSIDRIALIGFQGINRVRDPDEHEKSRWVQATNIAGDVVRDASGKEDEVVRVALNHAYDRLTEIVKENTDLSFVPRRELVRNAWYRTEHERRGRTPGFDLTTADGVIGFSLLSETTPQEREEFMNRLGVDAIATARIVWVAGSTREPGINGLLPGGKSIRPAANVSFTLWRRGVESPVWDEDGIRGCPAQQGIEDLGGINLFKDFGPALARAAELGALELVNRYQQALLSEDGSVGVSMDSLLGTMRCE